MSLGGTEILFIMLLALLLFGPKKLPEVGRTIGRTMREMKRISSEVTSVFEDALEDKPEYSSSSDSEEDSASGEDPYTAAEERRLPPYNQSHEWDVAEAPYPEAHAGSNGAGHLRGGTPFESLSAPEEMARGATKSASAGDEAEPESN